MAGNSEVATSQDGRKASLSEMSNHSQTAQEYIASQLKLEFEAREILPYQFDTCTNSLGPLRQTLFSCLTCNPPPPNLSEPYRAAGICYSCSISCHGEHDLVELFTRRNFVCDCGTTRISSNDPCTLRINPANGTKGDIRKEAPSATNTYNQNFHNRFCGCGELYDAHSEKGTMFQCIGLGTVEEGGCGEDWWHAECIMGLGRDWRDKIVKEEVKTEDNEERKEKNTEVSSLPAIVEEEHAADNIGQINDARNLEGTNLPEISAGEEAVEDIDEALMPPGFPDEDTFELFVCHKCTSAYPWIKRYAGTPGFLPGVMHGYCRDEKKDNVSTLSASAANLHGAAPPPPPSELPPPPTVTGKRKAIDDDDDAEQTRAESDPKRTKIDGAVVSDSTMPTTSRASCLYTILSPTPQKIENAPTSLFLETNFRSHLCRCPEHFPLLTPHPQLLEEEDAYEPPISDTGSDDLNGAPSTHGSRSLLERGEAALSTMDRVRAIEGVMVYNRLRDGLKDFLKPFAETGQAVGADDVKAYFEKLRGDDEVMKRMREEQGGGTGDDGK